MDLGPRHDHQDQADRSDVEQQDTQGHRTGHSRDGARAIGTLGGGDGGDLGPAQGEDDADHAAEHRGRPEGREAAVDVEVAHLDEGVVAQHEPQAEHDEHDDRRHLDRGEPELELAIGAGRHQVDAGHHRQQRPSDDPDGELRQPVMDDPGARQGLDGGDDRPVQPIEPAVGETRPVPQPLAGELGEGADIGIGDRHLAQHAHNDQHHQAGEAVGDDDRRSRRGDGGAGGDEQPRPDDPPDGDHLHVPRPKRLAELRRGFPGALFRRPLNDCHAVGSPLGFGAA